MSSKKLHSEKRKVKLWYSVRVSSDTKKLAEGILKTANDKETGRKIKLDEVLQADRRANSGNIEAVILFSIICPFYLDADPSKHALQR